jgi:hypothetical protein
MPTVALPPVWILEYCLAHPSTFPDTAIQRLPFPFLSPLTTALLTQIASDPDQPPLSSYVLIALMRRIFQPTDSLQSCSQDYAIFETLEYLQCLETMRLKRVRRITELDPQSARLYAKSSTTAVSQYNFALHGIRMWVCPAWGKV